MPTPTLTLPLILLASLWGAVTATLEFYQLLNARRDLVFALLAEPGERKSLIGPLDIYFTNMLPLSIGACLFLFLICYVVVKIPEHTDFDSRLRQKVANSCYFIATLPCFGFVCFFGGALFDFIKIQPYL